PLRIAPHLWEVMELARTTDELSRVLTGCGRDTNVARGRLWLQCRPNSEPDATRPGRKRCRRGVSGAVAYWLHVRGPIPAIGAAERSPGCSRAPHGRLALTSFHPGRSRPARGGGRSTL